MTPTIASYEISRSLKNEEIKIIQGCFTIYFVHDFYQQRTSKLETHNTKESKIQNIAKTHAIKTQQ
jgi:hypothetical protein